MNSRKSAKPLASVLNTQKPEWLDPSSQTGNDSFNLAIEAIHLPAWQPRRYFDPQALAQLTESVRQQGVLQPVLVRSMPTGDYELVAGERRLRAATAAGLKEIPAVIRELDDLAARQIALLENLQREDLNGFEETEGILELLSLQLNQPHEAIPSLLRQLFNATNRKPSSSPKPETLDSDNNVIITAENEASDSSVQEMTEQEAGLLKQIEEVFQQLNLMTWQSFVTNRLPLLNLPQDVQDALRQGQIAYTKAKVIAGVKDKQKRSQLLHDAIKNNWSLEEIKTQIAGSKTKESLPVQSELDRTYRQIRKAKIWENPKKQKKLESLLKQLNALLDD